MTRSDLDAAWKRYQDSERDRIRSVSMPLLEVVLNTANALPETDRESWARDISRQVVDEDCETPVRFPLFRDLLFPALLSGFKSGEPGCARWLAGFAQLLYKSSGCREQLPPEQRTEMGLLRAALRTDPDDALARSRLIDAIAWQLDHSLHELPSGVLYGMNGATGRECEELQADLEEFEVLVTLQGVIAEHSDRIAECRYHYWAYPAYLARREEFGSYEDYLPQSREV